MMEEMKEHEASARRSADRGTLALRHHAEAQSAALESAWPWHGLQNLQLSADMMKDEVRRLEQRSIRRKIDAFDMHGR